MLKKIISLALLCGLSSVSFATTSSNISYPTFTIPHNQEVVFDLEKGTTGGMKAGIYYDLTCTVTANEKIGLALLKAPFMTWFKVLLNGKEVNAGQQQFQVEPNSVLEIDKISFTSNGNMFPSNSKLNLVNLDHDNDLQLNCTAVPNYS